MKTTQTFKWLTGSAMAFVIITLSSWQITSNAPNADHNLDTSKPKYRSMRDRDYQVGDLDKALKDLDKAKIEMDKNLKIDFSKMEKEMKQAMEEMKKIDFDKISREVQESLKKVNWEDTRKEVEKAMREAEIKMKEVDLKKVKAEMEKVKEELKAEKLHAKIDFDKIQKEVNEGMEKAKIGIEKAKKEIAELKSFIDELDKDGLIDKKKPYKIAIKNKKLFINGKEQSEQVNEKYKRFLDKEDYSITSDGRDAETI